jgi:hypothetical protein
LPFPKTSAQFPEFAARPVRDRFDFFAVVSSILEKTAAFAGAKFNVTGQIRLPQQALCMHVLPTNLAL